MLLITSQGVRTKQIDFHQNRERFRDVVTIMLLPIYGYFALNILSDVLEEFFNAINCPAQAKVILESSELFKSLKKQMILIVLQDFWPLLGFWCLGNNAIRE